MSVTRRCCSHAASRYFRYDRISSQEWLNNDPINATTVSTKVPNEYAYHERFLLPYFFLAPLFPTVYSVDAMSRTSTPLQNRYCRVVTPSSARISKTHKPHDQPCSCRPTAVSSYFHVKCKRGRQIQCCSPRDAGKDCRHVKVFG